MIVSTTPERTIFQQIAEGNQPGYILGHSTRHGLLALLSHEPVVEGHSLVVPMLEPPVSRWQDLPPQIAAKAFLLGQVVAKRLEIVVSPSPALVTMHIMGYRVPQTHLKIIPSHQQGDTMPVYPTCPTPRPDVSASELEDMHRKLTFQDEMPEIDEALDQVRIPDDLVLA